MYSCLTRLTKRYELSVGNNSKVEPKSAYPSPQLWIMFLYATPEATFSDLSPLILVVLANYTIFTPFPCYSLCHLQVMTIR